jgi:hypothetical protein
VKKLLPSAFDRTCCVRTHSWPNAALTVKRRPSQTASHAFDLAGPRSPSLPACAVVVICGQTWSARSNAETSVHSNALPTFERRSVTCQSINRSLSSFGLQFFFLGDF